MQTGAITNYVDVAQLALYVFWLFFAGLIWYLHAENKREGYPLLPGQDRAGRARGGIEGLPPMPKPKTFRMVDGTTVTVPRPEPVQVVNGVPAAGFPGAPLIPNGAPLLSGMGPGAYANRLDVPDHTFDDGLPKIVPLRAAPSFFLTWEDPDLHGYTVIGCDGVVAGTVIETWIDRSEVVIRYEEVRLAVAGATHSVLLPINFAAINVKQKQLRVAALRGEQFALVPQLKDPDSVTLLEEDKIAAFYAGGSFYAMPGRGEPLL